MADAFIKYRKAEFPLWVMELEQDFGMAGTNAQAKYYQHWYPLSYTQGPLRITGKVRTQLDYNLMAEVIRGHQRHIAQQDGMNVMDQGNMLQLTIRSEGINVYGAIKSFQAGEKRFNPAPPFTFEFDVWLDPESDLRINNRQNISLSFDESGFQAVNGIASNVIVDSGGRGGRGGSDDGRGGRRGA